LLSCRLVLSSCHVGSGYALAVKKYQLLSKVNIIRREDNHLNRNELPVSFPLDSRQRKRRLARFELRLGLDCSSIRDEQKSELKSKSTSKRPFDRELAPGHFDERRRMDQIQHIIALGFNSIYSSMKKTRN
jgi:hypothetical protein